MTTAAFPYAGRDPLLMKEEPFDRPGDDAINDELARLPLVIARIVYAQAGKVRVIAVAVDMLRGVAVTARVTPNRWIHNEHRHVWVGQIKIGEIAPRKVNDPDAVGLTNRA